MLKKKKQLKIFSDGSSHFFFDINLKNKATFIEKDFKIRMKKNNFKNKLLTKKINYRTKFNINT